MNIEVCFYFKPHSHWNAWCLL